MPHSPFLLAVSVALYMSGCDCYVVVLIKAKGMPCGFEFNLLLYNDMLDMYLAEEDVIADVTKITLMFSLLLQYNINVINISREGGNCGAAAEGGEGGERIRSPQGSAREHNADKVGLDRMIAVLKL